MPISSKDILLIDFIGAVLTTTLLFLFIIKLQPFIGMPMQGLTTLLIFASFILIISGVSYLLRPKYVRQSLTIIIALNTSYCILVLLQIGLYSQELSYAGMAFFLMEIAVILILVQKELKVLRSMKTI